MKNDDAMPHGFKRGIELIPEKAKNMKELKQLKIKWDAGDKIYDKNHSVVKCFEESSGCFYLSDKFAENGGKYDHPSLKKLIRLEDYNNAAPTHYDVEKILAQKITPTGEENEFLVKFKGFSMEVWLVESACVDCQDLIEEAMCSHMLQLEEEEKRKENEKNEESEENEKEQRRPREKRKTNVKK